MAEESGLVPLQTDPRPAIAVFLKYGRGEDKDIKKVAQAGAHLVLYGLNEFADKPEVLEAMQAKAGQPKMQEALSSPHEIASHVASQFQAAEVTSQDEKATKSEPKADAKGSPEKAKAMPIPSGPGISQGLGNIDWMAIFPLVIQLIQLVLKPKA